MNIDKIINWLWIALMVFVTAYIWVLFPITVPIALLHLSEALERPTQRAGDTATPSDNATVLHK
jgi:hypothetical protein